MDIAGMVEAALGGDGRLLAVSAVLAGVTIFGSHHWFDEGAFATRVGSGLVAIATGLTAFGLATGAYGSLMLELAIAAALWLGSFIAERWGYDAPGGGWEEVTCYVFTCLAWLACLAFHAAQSGDWQPVVATATCTIAVGTAAMLTAPLDRRMNQHLAARWASGRVKRHLSEMKELLREPEGE